MPRQKHTIKIKSKDDASININKKEIWNLSISIIGMKSDNLQQKCRLHDNEGLFHMPRQKHTIKIKSKDDASININKKEIWNLSISIIGMKSDNLQVCQLSQYYT